MEHESHHHHHPHGTGVRWLDIILGVAATIVSLVSLWLGLHSAHSMEKLVAANSFPYLELMRSTGSQVPMPDGKRTRQAVEYQLVNNGIGPARIEWVEMRFKGKPVRDLDELMNACCTGWTADDVRNLNKRGGINGALVRAGGAVTMFSWVEPVESNTSFAVLHRQMDEVTWSACYCSVFDECSVRTHSSEKPESVKRCVAPAVSFRPGFKRS